MSVLPAVFEGFGSQFEPYVIALLPLVLEQAGDPKEKALREAAVASVNAIAELLTPFSLGAILPVIFDKILPKEKWQTRVLALQMCAFLCTKNPEMCGANLVDIIPKVSIQAGDARKEVAAEAEKCIEKACFCVKNKDLQPFIPALVSCLARPTEVQECVHKLSATTFVQAIEPATLAVIVPVLERGLRERAAATKRRAAIITDNMCKLVEKPIYAAPLLPTLLPLIDSARVQTADPEVRDICNKAYATLCKAAGQQADFKIDESKAKEEGEKFSIEASFTHIRELLCVLLKDMAPKTADEMFANSWANSSITHVAHLATSAAKGTNYDNNVWSRSVGTSVLAPFLGESESQAVIEKLRQRLEREEDPLEEDQDDEAGIDLCNCEFSLAYGGKILLNQARLHLKVGRRYGLCGANGCGKSTLMRAIANEQVEGFPPKTELKTAVVEHDLDGSLSELLVVDYLQAMLAKENIVVTPEEAYNQLAAVGFSPAMIKSGITTLSGGWKMKLALARAILQKPQILLLDEPTNHLDVNNVTWLVNYLTKDCENVSSIIVSHDTGFLDRVCTDIIHYNNFKLKHYKGNVSSFVKFYPEAKAWFSLEHSNFKFKLPEPGFLEGVTTKGKAIMKMVNVSFRYPNRDNFVLGGPEGVPVSVVCSLSSRVGCVGPNGAGKSTLIKVLTGETQPTTGSVWRHPSLRIAYVAQHAFHHLEEHLDLTPSEYIQWRYATGDDRENEDKEARKITDEEEKKMASQVVIDTGKFQVEQVLNRRKLKSSMEYEVSFVGMGPDKNKWMPRRWLEDNGFGKAVIAVDAREAAAAGLLGTPLTAQNIARHLADVGLENEFTCHHRMRGLSGGQKVKVVIGAATWMKPHMIVLDEPTNYLDRDSLGALAGAIKDFGGGVVIISHAGEFVNSTTTEKWLIGNGQAIITGETWNQSMVKLSAKEQAEETVDAAGNVIKIAKKLTEAEKKKIKKEKAKKRADKEKRRKRGEDVSEDEDDDDDEEEGK